MVYEKFLLTCETQDCAMALLQITNNLSQINGKWLIAACEYNLAPICLSLLSLGINVNYQDENGWSPLLLACENGSWDCILHLMECESLDVNIKSILPTGWTPLHAAVEHQHSHMVCSLISLGAMVDSMDENGSTPLMLCSLNGNTDIARFLHLHGANCNILTKQKRSAVWFGCYNGHLEIISLLIMWGAKFWIRDSDERTPLHIASYNGHTYVVKYLIHIGSSVNVCDSEGDSPLHIALSRGHLKTALELIKGGCSLFNMNYDRQTCYESMISMYDIKECKILTDSYNCYQRWLRRKNYILFLEGYKNSDNGEFKFVTLEGYSDELLQKCFLIYWQRIGKFL